MAVAMLVYGGWQGHRPWEFADYAIEYLLKGHEVVRSECLDVLTPQALAGVDVLIPIWTHGELTGSQETAIVDAVEQGMGLFAWHGTASAFTSSRAFKFLLGGHFVDHPGGDTVRYRVRFLNDDPLSAGLPDLDVVSEQYYLLIDPAVTVVADTEIVGQGKSWLTGVNMPVAWRREWGKGRVFYCALGHHREDLLAPTVTKLLRRAVTWTIRDEVTEPRQVPV